jgi:hypothetical protein
MERTDCSSSFQKSELDVVVTTVLEVLPEVAEPPCAPCPVVASCPDAPVVDVVLRRMFT